MVILRQVRLNKTFFFPCPRSFTGSSELKGFFVVLLYVLELSPIDVKKKKNVTGWGSIGLVASDCPQPLLVLYDVVTSALFYLLF